MVTEDLENRFFFYTLHRINKHNAAGTSSYCDTSTWRINVEVKKTTHQILKKRKSISVKHALKT